MEKRKFSEHLLYKRNRKVIMVTLVSVFFFLNRWDSLVELSTNKSFHKTSDCKTTTCHLSEIVMSKALLGVRQLVPKGPFYDVMQNCDFLYFNFIKTKIISMNKFIVSNLVDEVSGQPIANSRKFKNLLQTKTNRRAQICQYLQLQLFTFPCFAPFIPFTHSLIL